MSDSFAAQIAARIAPLDFANVYGFPNTVPDIKIWADILPKFGEYEGTWSTVLGTFRKAPSLVGADVVTDIKFDYAAQGTLF